MKKLNKKTLYIFIGLFIVTLIFTVIYFCNATQNVRSRLNDSELKTIDHFELFEKDSLTKDILAEKQFSVDEEQDASIPNSVKYVYHSLAKSGTDSTGIEHASVTVSDKGKIKKCAYWYSFKNLNDEQLEQVVNLYCKAAGKKSFTASYRLPKTNQQVTFKEILDLPLPGSVESQLKDLPSQNHLFVQYHLFQDDVNLIMDVYNTGEVKLFVSFNMRTQGTILCAIKDCVKTRH